MTSQLVRTGVDGSQGQEDLETLRAVEDRVLWLSTAMVHHANRVRANRSGLKVGGHQSSSASLVTIMTALWFDTLGRDDRVSVKPHASPVYHSIAYLLGRLGSSQLTTLREFGGLQSYPSRTKDPDDPDYSTGSVGIGATAPIWGTLARRYVDGHFGGAGTGRQYSLVGDAELDEGACWEAVLDPMVGSLGEVVWIVDLNRQSLDRVVPDIGAHRLTGMFEAAGWQVLTAKYGTVLSALFDRPGGDALRERIDTMSNPEYQRLLRCGPDELRTRLHGDGPLAGHIRTLLAGIDDTRLSSAVRNLGGHDLATLRETFAEIDDARPTVIFAYTIKGRGLPIEGHPQNHSALLTDEQMAQLALRLGADPDDPWRGLAAESAEAALVAATARRLARDRTPTAPTYPMPTDLGRTAKGVATTQSALGRTLLDLRRAAPGTAARVVTVSPDVSSSTNLGGWINKVGVWSADDRTDWFADDVDTILHWRESPRGQHIELGIAETNLVGVLGELGSTWSRWGQPLMPIGVLYDPFVGRALEPWSFGMYAGGQSILVGTPSGVSLAPEGGAHQSIVTPTIGLEQPGCTAYEPVFVQEVEWILLAALADLGHAAGNSTYLRLSTRPIDQATAGIPVDPAARERRRRQGLAGAYPLVRCTQRPDVCIAVMGAVTPEAVRALARLADLGVAADVVCVTSADLLFRALRARSGSEATSSRALDDAFPRERAAPLVTVLDGHPHTLAFLAAVHALPAVHLGVTRFGQSGDLDDVYAFHGIDADAIVRAALDLTDQ